MEGVIYIAGGSGLHRWRERSPSPTAGGGSDPYRGPALHIAEGGAIHIAEAVFGFQPVWLSAAGLAHARAACMADGQRLSKARRTGSAAASGAPLDDIIGLSAVPDALLARIVERLRPDIAEPHGAQRIAEKARGRLDVETRHGPLGIVLELPKDTTSLSWTVVSPQALLAHLTEISPFLATVLLSMPAPTFEQPWNIVLYLDEITPGNPLDAIARHRVGDLLPRPPRDSEVESLM